ncbi:MAG: cell division protein FtsZ [Candidatus Micrarchaeia archaeon]
MESIIRDALSGVGAETISNEDIRICVVGAGGAGCNTINRLAKVGIRGADLIALNTDAKHLNIVSPAAKRLLIGKAITKGLGAGGFPDIGRKSAEASKEEIARLLKDARLVFISFGLGGGTGTGSAPVVAEIAKNEGAIVVAVATYPFRLERARLKKADDGIREITKAADTLVLIDNNKLAEYAPNLPMEQAFMLADEITARAVRGIVETIKTPSLINLDFADVSAIMRGGGISMIAVGEGKGTERVKKTAQSTLNNVLLDVDYRGAKGVLLHLTGGPDMTLGEANELGELITEEVDPNANVIWGARLDNSFSGRIEAIAIFTNVSIAHTGEECERAEYM